MSRHQKNIFLKTCLVQQPAGSPTLGRQATDVWDRAAVLNLPMQVPRQSVSVSSRWLPARSLPIAYDGPLTNALPGA